MLHVSHINWTICVTFNQHLSFPYLCNAIAYSYICVKGVYCVTSDQFILLTAVTQLDLTNVTTNASSELDMDHRSENVIHRACSTGGCCFSTQPIEQGWIQLDLTKQVLVARITIIGNKTGRYKIRLTRYQQQYE